MSKIGLVCEATVPKGMLIEITVQEDIDGDGDIENEATAEIKDGKHIYELEGFQAERDNTWSHELTMGRDPDGPNLSPTRDDPQPPKISKFQLIVSGPTKSNNVDPKAVAAKFSESDYFLYQMQNCGPEAFRYNLSGFINAIYSIDEMIDKDWSDWANKKAESDLHDMLVNIRNQSVHLRKPSKGSLKPPLGHSITYDFGNSLERAYYLHDVPMSVIQEYVPEGDRITPAGDISIEDSPNARIVPVRPVCEVYFGLLQNRIIDWIENLNNANFSYDLEELY